METGTLYGVSVGPGDSGLITRKAMKTIAVCPVVAAPRTAGGSMVALDIAREVVDVSEKIILPLDFAMSPRRDAREASHRKAAALLQEQLDKGHSVAMLNLGDVSLYGSFQYMAGLLRGRYPVEMIPGVPSFCAAAAAANVSLTEMEKPLHLLPGSYPYEEGRALSGTRVYMKSGQKLSALLSALAEEGALGKTLLVQNCGLQDERILHGEDALGQANNSYFSLVIVKE